MIACANWATTGSFESRRGGTKMVVVVHVRAGLVRVSGRVCSDSVVGERKGGSKYSEVKGVEQHRLHARFNARRVHVVLPAVRARVCIF